MADDETPENQAEETAAAEADPAAVDPLPDAPAPKLSAKEARAAGEHRERSQRPSRTPQERDAERRELRRKKALARTRRRQQEKAKRSGDRSAGTPPAEPKVSTPQVRQGTVVSSKADKTITVRIDTARRHRRYEKIVRSTSTLHAHDERNDANEGDRVQVIESRPLSRTKRWRLVEVTERAR